MNKLIEFLKAKSFQMAITSISVCLVVVVSAGAIVHSNNKKLEAALNELSSSTATESVTESSSETTTESTTESTTAVSTTEKKKNITTTTATEPEGDKTIQYLAEYERITKEYEKKRAELEECTLLEPTIKISDYLSEEEKSSIYEANASADAHNQEVKETLNKIKELDEQYEKDIETLKRKYDIIK